MTALLSQACCELAKSAFTIYSSNEKLKRVVCVTQCVGAKDVELVEAHRRPTSPRSQKLVVMVRKSRIS